MIEVKKLSAMETYIVRHPILRAGKSVESCCFDGDTNDNTQHFGLYVNKQLIGVASLFTNSSSNLEGKQMQLRGMAILKEHQRKGYGELLLKTVEDYCRKENIANLWFNARLNALPFYCALKYQVVGEPFEIPDIGTHYKMYKNLK